MTIDRILQISNDVSEGMAKASKLELIAVIRYWQARCDAWNELHQKRMGQVADILVAHLTQPHPSCAEGKAKK